MRTVPLGGTKAKGRVALVDDDDFELVSQYKWYAKESRRRNGRVDGPYAATSVHKGGTCTTLRMHTLITGWPLVDHANHNGLDNQRHNLRRATKSQNEGNSRSGGRGASPFKGVSWDSRSAKWKAVIRVLGKTHYLGVFVDQKLAALAYDAKAREVYGEFACTNFPSGGIVQASAATTVGLVPGTAVAEAPAASSTPPTSS